MKLIEKLNNKMEYIFGLIGVIGVVFLLILSIIFYDGYNFYNNTVSSLGKGYGKLMFSIGFIIAGCLAIPFYIRLEKTLRGINETIRRIVIGISIVSCLAIALVGVIPDENFPKSFGIFHGLVAFTSFFGTSFYIGLYSYLMFKHEEYGLLIPIVGLLVLVALFFLLVLMLPIVEWVLTILIFLWISLVIIHKLRYNNENKN